MKKSLRVLFVSAVLASVPLLAAQTFTMSGPSGGLGGSAFYDPQRGGVRVVEIRINSGTLIDSIQVIYAQTLDGLVVPGDKHGGNGGSACNMRLAPNEYIDQVTGTHGQYVNSLQLRTNTGRVLSCGTKGPGGFSYSAPPGNEVRGFWGRSGTRIDAIGVMYATR